MGAAAVAAGAWNKTVGITGATGGVAVPAAGPPDSPAGAVSAPAAAARPRAARFAGVRADLVAFGAEVSSSADATEVFAAVAVGATAASGRAAVFFAARLRGEAGATAA